MNSEEYECLPKERGLSCQCSLKRKECFMWVCAVVFFHCKASVPSYFSNGLFFVDASSINNPTLEGEKKKQASVRHTSC